MSQPLSLPGKVDWKTLSGGSCPSQYVNCFVQWRVGGCFMSVVSLFLRFDDGKCLPVRFLRSEKIVAVPSF